MKRTKPDAQANSTPKVKYIKHGGGSLMLRDPIDGRTTIAKICRAESEALAAHLGGELTYPQRHLVEQCARLSILASIAWAELMTHGLFKGWETSSAFDAFLKASKDERELLKLLGLERKLKNVTKTLRELLDEDTD